MPKDCDDASPAAAWTRALPAEAPLFGVIVNRVGVLALAGFFDGLESELVEEFAILGAEEPEAPLLLHAARDKTDRLAAVTRPATLAKVFTMGPWCHIKSPGSDVLKKFKKRAVNRELVYFPEARRPLRQGLGRRHERGRDGPGDRLPHPDP